ncbi:adenylyltransferase/cytidyltransferase family protein [Candidatus Dojkabacteria bacterium]|uniref:Adenylyltransferase/cytidyltransferase family protein n=1 Tax=Candidatus Dojkabacteria bacterium TaxID=2099670 RepID=A0A955L336_9BACT|nr:adenylyltransferase/cytidyltransferase family protein [Candidatus Dojkabacteria bacterium]
MAIILDDKVVAKVCSNLGSLGHSVVFTHGAFDMLHVGHIEFLRKSEAKGKFLIIGVDSDERIYKYKSVTRPVIPARQRMEMLSSLSFVDAVFELSGSNLDADYYINLYEKIKPNVITVGPPFAFREYIPGYLEKLKDEKRLPRSTKFSVVKHKYSEVVSTTAVIEKILQTS